METKQRMKKKSMVLILICLSMTGLPQCAKTTAGEGKPAEKKTPQIELSASSVIADPTTGKISVDITFDNFDNLLQLEITKIDGTDISVETIDKSQLSEVYTYEYTVSRDDSNVFELEFLAIGSTGALSGVKTLEVSKPTGNLTLSIDKTTVLLPHSLPTGDFSIRLSFGNFWDLDYLLVEKTDWEETTSYKIYSADLAAEYTFEYTAEDSDSDYFSFRFTAVDSNGLESDSKQLTVDRRSKLGFEGVKFISRVTGAEDNRSPMPTPQYAVNNRTDQMYDVGGTDLGIIWEMDPGHYGIFFGDTFGANFKPNFSSPGPNGGNWRSNVLLFSDDQDLSDGLTISGAATDGYGRAREIVYGGKDQSGNGDWTSIPTAAIRANGSDYVHYMNIRKWVGWFTNYSSFYRSDDNGKTWTRRTNMDLGEWSNFGQAGFFKKDGYVYMMGTVTGRSSKPHVARFREKDIERRSEYEYWNAVNQKWVKGSELSATAVIDDKAGELSIAYHQKYGKWIVLYINEDRYEITFREANEITGPWSEAKQVIDGHVYSQPYGNFIHPLSLKGDKLYFILSMWLPYNTYLLSMDLVRK